MTSAGEIATGHSREGSAVLTARCLVVSARGNVEPGGYDQVVVRGNAGRRELIAFWLRGGRVLAGMNFNIWDVNEVIQDIVRAGRTVDPGR